MRSSLDDVIDSLGIGVMVGMRRSPKSDNSLNIGLGLIVDPNSQLLGDGIVANQPLPAGSAGAASERQGIVIKHAIHQPPRFSINEDNPSLTASGN